MCCRVASCCCIGDLRLATLIIAVVSLLGNVGLLAFTAWCIKVTRLALLYFLNNGASGERDLVLLRGLRVALAILAVILIISVVAIVLDVVLFFGAFRRRRDMVLCWSHGHAVVCGACLVYFWVVLVGLFADGYIWYGLMVLVATILGAVVTAYFWVVVRSYDLKLQRTNLNTVCGSSGPSTNNSYVPASSRPGASWDTDKPLPGTLHSPPPYNVLP